MSLDHTAEANSVNRMNEFLKKRIAQIRLEWGQSTQIHISFAVGRG